MKDRLTHIRLFISLLRLVGNQLHVSTVYAAIFRPYFGKEKMEQLFPGTCMQILRPQCFIEIIPMCQFLSCCEFENCTYRWTAFPFFPCKTKAWRGPHKRSKRVAVCRPAAEGNWISKAVSDALTHLTAQTPKLYFRPPLPHKIHNRNFYNVRSAANEFAFCSSRQQSRRNLELAAETRLAAKLCTIAGSSRLRCSAVPQFNSLPQSNQRQKWKVWSWCQF